MQPLHQTGLLTELQEKEVGGTKEGGGVVDVQIFATCCVKCTKGKNCVQAHRLQTLPGFDFVMWRYILAWMTC